MAQQGNVVTGALRLFGIGKKQPRPSRVRRGAVVPLDNEEKMKSYVRHVALNEGYKDLTKDRTELAKIGRNMISNYTQDDRPLEQQILTEEVRRNPALRRQLAQLILEKRRAEMGITSNGRR